MSTQEILEKAIQKAIDGGWEHGIPADHLQIVEDKGGILFYYQNPPYDLIFNHDFAKALWGEEAGVLNFPEGKIHLQSPLWQYHLQQMVIADDPIKYLGENL
ncbi:hypothetical protein EKI60_06250 [Candidatus Saccharibacteria bacterium]|nr:MAG: hypothetical protein EKI60_06250 [Candidatus Saccharibacteria bacterium]